MPVKDHNPLQRSDLTTVLEVNAKAVSLLGETLEQFQEIIEGEAEITRAVKELTKVTERVGEQLEEVIEEVRAMKQELSDDAQLIKTSLSKEIDDIEKETKEINKVQFKILFLLSGGVLGLIGQIVALLWHH